MANKKEVKQTLKEMGLTEAEVDKLWIELAESGLNSTVAGLHKNGIDWRTLNPSAIKSIKGLMEKCIEQEKEKKAKEEKRQKIEEQSEAAKDFYYANFFDIMYTKVELGLRLNEYEISELVYEHNLKEYEKTSEKLRWTLPVRSIVSDGERYMRIHWDKGLTESQEDMFMDQPEIVTPHTYEKIITVTDWV